MIEQEIGSELSWEKLENARASRIALYTIGSIEAGDSELAELSDWSVENIIKFQKVFGNRIKTLAEQQKKEFLYQPGCVSRRLAGYLQRRFPKRPQNPGNKLLAKLQRGHFGSCLKEQEVSKMRRRQFCF